MSIQNNKKALAEKLKSHLNALEYVAVPDLIKSNDYHPSLTYYGGEWVSRNRKFIDFEKEAELIYDNQLEPSDWKEIISLIKQRNEEREQNYQAKKKKIEDKVNSQPGLYYYYGSQSRNRPVSSFDYGDKQGYYFGLWGSENGRSFYLNINNNHPVLDTFPYKKHGYYLIETDKSIERNDGVVRPWSSSGETNPSNFHKWVEVGDKITITPYEVETNNQLPENPKRDLESKGKNGCDTCHKKLGRDWGGSDNFYIMKRYHGKVNIGGPVIWNCLDCYPTKEQEYLQNYETVWERYLDKDGSSDYRQIKFSFVDCYAGHKDQNGQVLKQENCSHCQPWKHHETSNPNSKEFVDFLIQYFQEKNIKKIKLVNGELVIEYNNKNVSATEAKVSPENQALKKYLIEKNIKELTEQELRNRADNTTPTKEPNDNKVVWISVGIGGTLLLGVIVGLLIKRKKVIKNN